MLDLARRSKGLRAFQFLWETSTLSPYFLYKTTRFLESIMAKLETVEKVFKESSAAFAGRII